MNVGSTSVRVASVATVASALAVPSALNVATRWRSVAASSDTPTTPLQVMITAANTVSRASVEVSVPPATISVTIRATSMTVTATARTIDPNGSPTRCATTSAWCTEARTDPARNPPTTISTTVPGFVPQVAAVVNAASTGTTVVQRVDRRRFLKAS